MLRPAIIGLTGVVLIVIGTISLFAVPPLVEERIQEVTIIQNFWTFACTFCENFLSQLKK